MPNEISKMLRVPEAAAYLGLAPSTLAKMRLRGDSPRYAKAGPRIVVYDVRDLDAWLEARKRSSTSQEPVEPDTVRGKPAAHSGQQRAEG
jgi:predicted DNA-binding transcriptional regulator AlpA